MDVSFSAQSRTPIWFWFVAVLAVLWNFGGVFDFAMMQFSESYLQQLTDAQRAYFTSFPFWYEVIWALAVLMAFLSSLALVFRSRLAMPGFAIAIGLYVLSAFYNFGLNNGAEIMGTGGVIFAIVIALSLVGLWLFSQAMLRRGFLR
jgi:hypothetical protein